MDGTQNVFLILFGTVMLLARYEWIWPGDIEDSLVIRVKVIYFIQMFIL